MADSPNPFAAPQTASAPGDDVWGDTPPEALLKVKTGLSMVYYSICGMLLLGILWAVLLFTLRGGLDDEMMEMLGLMLGGGFLLLALVGLAGQGFCLAVPAETGARGLVQASIALQGVTLFASMASLVSGWPSGDEPILNFVLGAAMMVLNLAGMACFILFMRRVALHIARRDVAGRATRALVAGVLAAAVYGTGLVLMQYSEQMGVTPGVVGIVSLVGMVGILIALIMYANTVTYLRKAIVV
jgi:hypothetical protein